MNKILSAFFTLLIAFGHANADPRIREEIYNRDKVYSIYTQIGTASLIQFAPDETLLTPSALLGIGDAEAWHVGVKGNNISLKPAATLPKTNLTIVTNKRTYSFDLRPASERNLPTYVLRFVYMEDEAAAIAALRKRHALKEKVPVQKKIINTNYTWKGSSGDAALAPTAAWDDGRFTRLEYNHGGELPVFFKVLPDGTEALVNYNIDDKAKETIVLQEVVQLVRARLNEQVIEIRNRGYVVADLNRSNAGDYGTMRTEGKDRE